MIVKFHILQRDDETGNTRNKFLFSDDIDEIAQGKNIEYKQKKYRIQSLEWVDKTLNAVCIEVL